MSNATTPGRAVNRHGYQDHQLGEFTFSRDEYFAHITWPTGSHVMSIDSFLRAIQRDVAWNFFYGTVNFDHVVGTLNHYGTVDLFAGTFNDAYRKAELEHLEIFPAEEILAGFKAMLDGWTNAGFDPFAAPEETGTAWGDKAGSNTDAVTRRRVAASRMVGVPGDEALRRDDNGFPVNRQFADVDQAEPEIHAEPGFEDQVCAFNLFRAPMSHGTLRWCRYAGTACTVRRPRSTSCRSSTATTGSNGSCNCRTRSSGRWPTR